MSYERLKSEIVYTGRVFTIRVDTVRLPDGRQTRLDVVEHDGSVIIIPMDAAGNLLFVRQYRHPAGLDLLELPAGMLNQNEDPLTSAHREVREETGMRAETMEHLGGFFLAPGYSTEYMNVYLATSLVPDPLEADADEDISVIPVPLSEALTLAGNGEIPDAKSLAALLLLKNRLEKG